MEKVSFILKMFLIGASVIVTVNIFASTPENKSLPKKKQPNTVGSEQALNSVKWTGGGNLQTKKIGLLPGDVITHIEGQKYSDSMSAIKALNAAKKKGTPFLVKVRRGQEVKDLIWIP